MGENMTYEPVTDWRKRALDAEAKLAQVRELVAMVATMLEPDAPELLTLTVELLRDALPNPVAQDDDDPDGVLFLAAMDGEDGDL